MVGLARWELEGVEGGKKNSDFFRGFQQGLAIGAGAFALFLLSVWVSA